MDSASFKVGNNEVSVKGQTVVIVVVMLACTAFLGYAGATALTHVGARVENMFGIAISRFDVMRKEHEAIFRSQDRSACIQTMTPAERERFRASYSAGAFARWCSWIKED